MAMFNDKHHHPLRLAVVPWRNDRPVFGTDNFAAIIIIMIIRTCELDTIGIVIVFTITITQTIFVDKIFCCLWPLFSPKIKSTIQKENSQFPSQPLNDWVMSKRGSLFLRITSHSIKGTITFAVTRVNMRNIYTSSQTQSQRHLSLQHLQTQRPNKVGLLCGAAQIIRKKVDKWFCTQWLALWQTPHFWQGHRLRQQCNWKSTLFYFLTPTFFMAILRCFVSGLLSINVG